jgi:hypothetical protein
MNAGVFARIILYPVLWGKGPNFSKAYGLSELPIISANSKGR